MKWFALENVLTLKNVARQALTKRVLGPSNLSVTSFLVSKIGYILHSWQLCPTMFGVPQTRGRIWMTCVSAELINRVGMSEAEVHAALDAIMSSLTGVEVSPLDAFLLNESDAKIQNMQEKMREDFERSSRSLALESSAKRRRIITKTKDPETFKWYAQHEQAFIALGEDYTLLTVCVSTCFSLLLVHALPS
jgi:site-specific DNA-cytosine methylase